MTLRMDPSWREGDIAPADDTPIEAPKPKKDKLEALFSSEQMGWETPPWVIQVASRVAPIELDPATSSRNPTGARRFFTPSINGLIQSWRLHRKGQLWLNPPFGRAIKVWIEKLGDEAAAWATEDFEGQLLTPARVDTQWFQKDIARRARCCVYLEGRVEFVDPETGEVHDPAPFPTAISYYGPNPRTFAKAWAGRGLLHRFPSYARAPQVVRGEGL